MGKRLTFGAYPIPLFRRRALRVAQPERTEMKLPIDLSHPPADMDEAKEMLKRAERELSDLRAKLAAAEKDAERKDSALRIARAAVTLGTTDGGKAVVKLIDAAIEKERSRG